MASQEVSIKQNVSIILKSDTEMLDDVVVVAYGTAKKSSFTGSATAVSGEKIAKMQVSSVSKALEGAAAGVQVINTSGQPGENAKIRIRGIGSFSASSAPLYVVDGMPYEGDLASINPTDVQNITVLKDAAASSIYGARAANGVIVITTKRGQEGKTKVSYNGSIKLSPKPDFDYLNLMSSSELVDMQIEGFDYYHTAYENLNKRQAVNPVVDLLYQHERGQLTDSQLADALLPYLTNDNRKQI